MDAAPVHKLNNLCLTISKGGKMFIDMPAMPAKPSTAATSAITRNTAAQYNMSSSFQGTQRRREVSNRYSRASGGCSLATRRARTRCRGLQAPCRGRAVLWRAQRSSRRGAADETIGGACRRGSVRAARGTVAGARVAYGERQAQGLDGGAVDIAGRPAWCGRRRRGGSVRSTGRLTGEGAGNGLVLESPASSRMT